MDAQYKLLLIWTCSTEYELLTAFSLRGMPTQFHTLNFPLPKKRRQTGRQADRKIDRKTRRQTDKRTDSEESYNERQ